jgi:hypothetical protein
MNDKPFTFSNCPAWITFQVGIFLWRQCIFVPAGAKTLRDSGRVCRERGNSSKEARSGNHLTGLLLALRMGFGGAVLDV